jgi:SAM-dependent methyltransferase
VFVRAAAQFGLEVRPGDTVLEVGCAEADWLALAEHHQPDASFIGVDVRPYTGKGKVAIQGDIFEQEFGNGSLDGVVMVSALEHIGLGHYGDPAVENGDHLLMSKLLRWLKPGGWVYADVPWNADRAWTDGTSHRVYSPMTIDAFGQLEHRAYYMKDAIPLTERAAIECTGGSDDWVYCANLWRKS